MNANIPDSNLHVFLVEALFVLVVVVVCVQEVLEDKDVAVAAAVVVRVVNFGHRKPEEPLALQRGLTLHCLVNLLMTDLTLVSKNVCSFGSASCNDDEIQSRGIDNSRIRNCMSCLCIRVCFYLSSEAEDIPSAL